MIQPAYFQVYLISAGILIILLIRAKADNDRHFAQYRLFTGMLVTALVATLCEALSWYMEGRKGPGLHELALVINVLLFLVNLLPSMLWLMYTQYLVMKSMRRIQITRLILAAIAILNGILALASPWTGWYFGLDADNSYSRGSLFWIAIVLNYSILAWALFNIISNRTRLPRRLFLPMTLYCVPPIIGAVLQVMIYGLSLIWGCVALSLLIIYTSIQKQILSTDYLTGLYNRRQLDTYMSHGQNALRTDHHLAVLMIDIDDFKSINDIHGHATGDEAIEATATILRKTFHHEDFLARYAGDEFVAIIEISDQNGLDSLVMRLHQQFARFNKANNHPYRLSVSVGDAIRKPGDSTPLDALLKIADQRMYQVKAESKRQNTDKTQISVNSTQSDTRTE